MKLYIFLLIIITSTLYSCNQEEKQKEFLTIKNVFPTESIKPFSIDDVQIKKELLYDQYTLEDEYPYQNKTRKFQWDKIRKRIAYLETIQRRPSKWAILQNYRNRNGEASLVKYWKRDEYKRISDTLGTERFQGIPMFLESDSITAEVYGRDGSLIRLLDSNSSTLHLVETIELKGRWYVPQKYVKQLHDSIYFKKAIFIDVTNQNIATLEHIDSLWVVRSMNPVTTGVHKPPYAQETPLGIYIVQEHKAKMLFLKDGTTENGGFAPYASRFTNGAYIHGVPVNAPRKELIEYSPSLGTTPRSHMCVRNATSHAKFVYDWAPIEATVIFVLN